MVDRILQVECELWDLKNGKKTCLSNQLHTTSSKLLVNPESLALMKLLRLTGSTGETLVLDCMLFSLTPWSNVEQF